MKSKNSDAIQALIQDFADKLDVLIRADIIRLITEIVGNGGNVHGKQLKAPKAAPGKSAKRSPEVIEALANRLLAYVSKHPGQRIEQIGEGMSLSTKELRLPVLKLIAEKKLSTKGHKRATSYSIKG